jgi:hypothetical protein
VAELADAQVSEACDGDIVEVQVLSSAPNSGLSLSEPLLRGSLFYRYHYSGRAIPNGVEPVTIAVVSMVCGRRGSVGLTKLEQQLQFDVQEVKKCHTSGLSGVFSLEGFRYKGVINESRKSIFNRPNGQQDTN